MRLGIDFGTCFSNAALMMAKNSLQTVKDPIKHGYSFPSSVYVTERGELLIGSVAENARQRDLRRYKREFKRELGQNIPYQLGERRFKPEELVCAVLREIKTEAEKIVEGYGHRSVTNTLITVPATYQRYKRGLMEQAARAAGFDTVELLEEPVAAAIYYSWQFHFCCLS